MKVQFVMKQYCLDEAFGPLAEYVITYYMTNSNDVKTAEKEVL